MKVTKIEAKPSVDPYHADTSQSTKTEFWLDPRDCTVRVEQGWDTNSTPATVWHGRVFVIQINGHPTENEWRKMIDSLADDIKKVCAGYSDEWDGHNIVGRLTTEANEALGRINDALTNHWWVNEWEVWLAEDWLQDDERLTHLAEMSDEQIKALATEIESELPKHTTILDDVESWLMKQREWLLDQITA